ncbi:MAG TPA: hypothetical protein VHV32_18880 [Candidatus Angelobacter sp.]|jgi:hypothetical protein|nr:hypothetical protein [Candidatus Angelobacter sp.]
MSLADWTGLTSSISSWIHRADSTAIAPDLISLFEAEFNNEARVRQMESETSITSSGGAIAHPTDWIGWKIIKQTYNGVTYNLPISGDEYATDRTVGDTSAPPRYAVVVGAKTYVRPADDGLIYPTVYYASLPALSASQTTNWLLTKYPNLYLFGSLLFLSAYNINDDRIPVWKAARDDAMARLKADSKRAKFGHSTLQMRPDSWA